MRIDSSSLGVMALAVASALTTAWWLNHAGARGQAYAAPPVPVYAAAQGTSAQVLKAPDGHYWADALIDASNGQRAVRVMVDTGASVVALTPADAVRLGLRLKPEDFSGTVITASGRVRAAPVQLQAVAVAGTRVEHVEALVVERGLPHSLLRNGWYTENYAASIPPALAHGALIGSAGDGRIASAARADYAEAAAVALIGDQAPRVVYELAGDASYSLAEFAAELSRQAGKTVPYVDMPEADYRGALLGAGLPEGLASLLADSDAAAAKGALNDESRVLSRLIGRPTTPFATTIAEALRG